MLLAASVLPGSNVHDAPCPFLSQSVVVHDTIALYRFLDWVMTLPDDLARAYVDAMDDFEKEQKMTYLSYAERLAQEKGIEQGIRTGRIQAIARQLRRLFGPLADDDLAGLESLSIAQLDRLSEDLLDFTQPADLAQWLRQPPEDTAMERG